MRLQLLGLRGRDSYLDPQILAAYEALSASPLEEGFSTRAADGRSYLLQSALEELRRTRGRALPVQGKGIDVEWALLPGALALLQEVRWPPVTLTGCAGSGRRARLSAAPAQPSACPCCSDAWLPNDLGL